MKNRKKQKVELRLPRNPHAVDAHQRRAGAFGNRKKAAAKKACRGKCKDNGSY